MALAYAALGIESRLRVIDAVVSDSAREGICSSSVLASLLAVEDDIAVARRIASEMSAAGDEGLRCAEADNKALLCGDGHSGSLVVLRPLHGHFLEALGVSWRDGEGIVEVFFEPITTTAAAEERACTLADGGDLERIPVSFAVDLLTPVIWNHRRRHGSVPDVLQRFADLFAAPSEP
ncbi:MAG: hypothetical protein OEZ06_06090 [Myxococcales bacterium]|nr:hypothetical protein [Myxococcales bacterium]